MKENSDNNYSIYINGKLYNVSYLCFLCHCYKKFNGLKDWDTYISYSKETFLKAHTSQINYLILLDSFINRDKKILPSRVSNSLMKTSSKKNIILLGLIYREFKDFWVKSSTRTIKLNNVLIFNKIINYSSIEKSTAYNSLGSLLKFYKLLALETKDNILTKNDIAEVLNKINSTISVNDIRNDFKNHLIVVPYKDYYIWSCNAIYEWLIKEDRLILNALILNKDWV